MKKIYLVIIICIVMYVLIGCDRYWIKKPYECSNSVWISESPYLEMKVYEDGYSESKFMINDELKNVRVVFMAERVACYPMDGENADKLIDVNKYFLAECVCSKEKCVLKIKEKKEGILEGIDEIVLVNQKYKDKVD